MIAANVARLLAVASLPLACVLGLATLAQFFIVAAICGCAGVVFDTAYAGFLPRLVGIDRLAEGNAKMAASASVAEVAGNAVAGGLIAACGAPIALALNACTFVYGTIQLFRIRCAEPVETPSLRACRAAAGWVPDARAGVAFVARSRPLRTVAASSAIAHFAGAMSMAVFYIFVFREIHLAAALVGLVLGFSNVGAVAATFASRLAARIGRRRTLVIATLLGSLAQFVIPLASLGTPLVALVTARMMLSFAGPLFDVNSDILRGSLATDAMQARVAATMRTIVWGTMPFGALAGGWLGVAIGSTTTMCVAGAIGIVATCVLFGCPRAAMEVAAPRAITHARPLERAA